MKGFAGVNCEWAEADFNLLKSSIPLLVSFIATTIVEEFSAESLA